VRTMTTAQATATLAANNIRPVAKTLRVDLIALLGALDPAGKFFAHDKPEGIALIDGGKKLVVSNDSDFGILGTSPATFGMMPKISPGTGEVDYGEILIIDLAKLPARTATATVTITVGDTQAPVITAPANLTVVTSSPVNNCAAVNFSVTATDNCGATTVTSDPPSGSCFPLGATTVTSTATDSAGNKSAASFKVTVWDGSLQDDRSGDLLLFNSRTGDYSYTRCADGTKLEGKGSVGRLGCQITLNNAQVSAVFERCAYNATGRGRVAVRLTPFGSLLTINDSNTADNTTGCR
ncbi:MAG: HYR domain-containing protein, partial [Blastocatellia bacterium]